MGFVRSDTVVDRDYVLSDAYELEVASVRVCANVKNTPLIDAKLEKVKV